MGHRPQRHIAEYPGIAEHVLIFDITAVAPAVNFDGEDIAAFFDKCGDVEFGRKFGIFGVPHLLAVDPHVIG